MIIHPVPIVTEMPKVQCSFVTHVVREVFDKRFPIYSNVNEIMEAIIMPLDVHKASSSIDEIGLKLLNQAIQANFRKSCSLCIEIFFVVVVDLNR
jgi:hypothetical protein